jgi:hypothetical protein
MERKSNGKRRAEDDGGGSFREISAISINRGKLKTTRHLDPIARLARIFPVEHFLASNQRKPKKNRQNLPQERCVATGFRAVSRLLLFDHKFGSFASLHCGSRQIVGG